MLRLYRIAPDVTTLGPGNRFCLWVQGCHQRCPGCMSPESRPLDGGFLIDEETLAARMLAFDFEGLTISGGEPMLQCAALTRLIRLIRERRDVGVIVYTGLTLEALRQRGDPDTDAFLQQIDLLIDGEYIRQLDDNGALRGSSNQQAHHLTSRYRQRCDNFGQPGQRRQQLTIDEYGVLLIGLRDNPSENGAPACPDQNDPTDREESP